MEWYVSHLGLFCAEIGSLSFKSSKGTLSQTFLLDIGLTDLYLPHMVTRRMHCNAAQFWKMHPPRFHRDLIPAWLLFTFKHLGKQKLLYGTATKKDQVWCHQLCLVSHILEHGSTHLQRSFCIYRRSLVPYGNGRPVFSSSLLRLGHQPMNCDWHCFLSHWSHPWRNCSCC